MGFGHTRAVALRGVNGFVVDVEAHVAPGLPGFAISGLGDSAVKQSSDRIKAVAALIDGLPVSQRRVTVNLSPAGERKVGTGFDLAIFVAVAAAMGVFTDGSSPTSCTSARSGSTARCAVLPGVLPLVQRRGQRRAARGRACRNAAEARLVTGVRVHPVADVRELVHRYRAIARGHPVEPVPEPPQTAAPGERRVLDLEEVLGQAEAKVAVEIAAAGGHHLLLAGPPGAGKTMLAERLPGLLPPLDEAQSMAVTAIHSVLGTLGDDVRLITQPPFIAPHHGASMSAIIGGGSGHIRPGAITQAHNGVLFLDETPEFDKGALQALRTPLERGTVTIARAHESVTFPSRFQLVLAANPCPCGNGWGKGVDCTCSVAMRRAYFGSCPAPCSIAWTCRSTSSHRGCPWLRNRRVRRVRRWPRGSSRPARCSTSGGAVCSPPAGRSTATSPDRSCGHRLGGCPPAPRLRSTERSSAAVSASGATTGPCERRGRWPTSRACNAPAATRWNWPSRCAARQGWRDERRASSARGAVAAGRAG